MEGCFLGGARNKAGMPEADGLERQKIDDIIREASRGSKFYEHQQKRESRILDKIASLKQKKQSLEKMFSRDTVMLERAKKDVEMLVQGLESQRDLTRTFVCIDMDAFYAAVETLDRPEWASVPMAVGGKSMLCTANYEARKFGVVSAMPGFIAMKLCPHLIITQPDFEKYKKAAQKFHEVFRRYDPNFTHFSLDEATLDITEKLNETLMSPEDLVQQMRKEVFEVSSLTCSAGIAANRMLAKICSNLNKPNGQYCLPNDRDQISEFIHKTKLSRVNGIGKVTAKIIEGVLHATTIEELWNERIWIKLLFSEIQSEFLLRCCLGLGNSHSDFDGDSDRRSMSVERTFSIVSKTEAILATLEELCEDLAQQLDSEGLAGKNITIKMKASDFAVTTRALTLKRFISSSDDLFQHAKGLLVKHRPAELRLLGVRLAALESVDTINCDEDISQYFSKFDQNEKFVKCPICLLPIKDATEDGDESVQKIINDHIDTCLTKSALSEPSNICPPVAEPKRKAHGIDHFFKKLPKN